MKVLLLFPIAALMTGCFTETVERTNGKLVCVVDTGEAFTVRGNVGATVFMEREQYADPICKEKK